MISSFAHFCEKGCPAAAAFFLLLLAVFSAHPVYAGNNNGSSTSYEMTITGIEDADLENLLLSVSDTYKLRNNPPPYINLLRKRVENDLPMFEEAMRSQGYYDSRIGYRLDSRNNQTIVKITVDTGPRYHFGEISIRQVQPSEKLPFPLPSPQDLDIQSGGVFLPKKVLSAQSTLLTYLYNRGFPFADIARREVVVDHATRKVKVTYSVDPGPKVLFGRAVITGNKKIKEDFVLDELPWKIGDRFNQSLLNKARANLIRTGLFSIVNVTKGDLEEDSRLPVLISVKERVPRTVSFGVGYQTDIGLGSTLGWEHRNLFGGGEQLRFSLMVSELKSSLEALFKRQDFIFKDQSLILRASYKNEKTDAYTSKSWDTSATVERQLRAGLALGAGVRYRVTEIEQDDQYYGLLSFPVYLNLDYSDDLLDPSKGGRLNIWVAPYYLTTEDGKTFTKFQASYSHYFQLITDRKLIFAVKGSFGQILGVSANELPKDELFFAGGGGSVRGFAYQTAGDIEDGKPTGGLSLLELSGELRYKMTKSTGLVAFVDAGRAFSGDTPEIGKELFIGAGLGFRYYTSIGPIRFDAAVPLNQRADVDESYQIYVSIGQAF